MVREIKYIALDFRYSSFKMIQNYVVGHLLFLSEVCELRIEVGVDVSPKLYPSLKLILIFCEHSKTLKFKRGRVATRLHWEC